MILKSMISKSMMLQSTLPKSNHILRLFIQRLRKVKMSKLLLKIKEELELIQEEEVVMAFGGISLVIVFVMAATVFYNLFGAGLIYYSQ